MPESWPHPLRDKLVFLVSRKATFFRFAAIAVALTRTINTAKRSAAFCNR